MALSSSKYRCACGCGQIGTDQHHALFGRRKAFPELDAKENMVLVEHYQHIARKFDNSKWRIFFWNVQVERFGAERMNAWLDSLPAKLQGRVKELRRLVKSERETK